MGPVTFGRLKGVYRTPSFVEVNCCFSYKENYFQNRTEKFKIVFMSDNFRIDLSLSRVKMGTITRSIAGLCHEILSFRFRTYINKWVR